VVSFTPRPLYQRGKIPRYPLDRRLVALQSRFGRRGEGKILDPTGSLNQDYVIYIFLQYLMALSVAMAVAVTSNGGVINWNGRMIS
jgi:hypothetical protein